VRRILTALVTLVLLVSVGAAGYWAGATAVVPPELPVESHATQTYVAEVGTVGRSADVPITAAWATAETLFGNADGVVTAVRHQAGTLAKTGDIIATVELRPVVVAHGRVPMFRALGRNTRGPDVRQFQALLLSKGFLKGKATGRFDRATMAATRRWQKSIGVKQDGVVRPSDVIFVDRLPARLAVVPAVGLRVASGSEFVRLLEAAPAFSAVVSASARAELASGMTVSITAPDRASTWVGTLGTFEATPEGRYIASISGNPCGAGCEVISVTGETALAGIVELVPVREGVVVPVSALVQTPTGGAAVALPDGGLRGVSITSQADGFAIVEGLEPGTMIVLPGVPAP
jgi:peptidoglycan hydrolase-like protein with peptidoglycan-binding domain